MPPKLTMKTLARPSIGLCLAISLVVPLGADGQDTSPPVVTQIFGNADLNEITIVYSEPVDEVSATRPSNYNLSTLYVSSVDLLSDHQSVRLSISARYNPDTDYEIGIYEVRDLAYNELSTNLTWHSPVRDFLPGLAQFEVYFGLSTSDGSIADLMDDPRYPAAPSLTTYVTALTSRQVYPDDSHDGYGAVLKTLFVPPESGNFEFYLLSDNSSQLWLSTDSDFANSGLIAEELSCCGPVGKWGTYSDSPIALVKGQRYAMTLLYKESSNEDYAYVFVRSLGYAGPFPSLEALAPISGSALLMPSLRLGPAVVISKQPQSQIITIFPIPVPGEEFTTGPAGFTVQNLGLEPASPWQFETNAALWVTQGSLPNCGFSSWATVLQSPAYTVKFAGTSELTLRHRYSFQSDRWDGGQIRFSKNGGPFQRVTNFTYSGYRPGNLIGDHVLNGQPGFNGTSPDYEFADLVESIAELGPFNAGDELKLQFVAAFDKCFSGINPSWVIDSLAMSPDVQAASPQSPVTFSVETEVATLAEASPLVAYIWQRRNPGELSTWEDIPGARTNAYSFYPSLRDNGARFRCIVSVPGAGTVTSSEALLTLYEGSVLTIRLSGGNVVVEGNTGWLQSAPTAFGPWTDIWNYDSPYVSPATNSATFYRSRQ